MLRITPMPSILGLVRDSYRMTTTGKVFLGAMLAQALADAWKENQRQSGRRDDNGAAVAQAIIETMRCVDAVPALRAQYDALSEDQKRHFFAIQLGKQGLRI